MTVVEALDQATERIAASFSDQPLVEAEARHTIGTAYKNLGRYDRARPLLEAADDTRIRLLGRDDPETIKTLQALAETRLARLPIRRGRRSDPRAARPSAPCVRRSERRRSPAPSRISPGSSPTPAATTRPAR